MELLIFGILFILNIIFFIKTNNKKRLEKNKSINLYILICSFKGMLILFITGCLFSAIANFEWKGQHHPHSMLSILYPFYSGIGIILGFIVGLILATLNKTNINEKLILLAIIYSSILSIPTLIIVF